MKIKFLYLNLTNYPYIEEYLDKMAKNGYILEKILLQNIFIFKKSNLKNVKYSISPFQYETALNILTPDEVNEFNDACSNIGWTYIEKTSNLFIYYTVLSDLEDIHTDSEVEFNVVYKLVKNQVKFHYILLPILIFLTWIQLSNIYSSPDIITNSLSQIQSLLIPLASILVVNELIYIRHFLKLNKNRQEVNEEIIFLKRNQKFYSFIMKLILFLLAIFIINILFMGVMLGNKFIVFAYIPLLIGSIFGFLYRKFIKVKKSPKKNKLFLLLLVLVFAGSLSFISSLLFINDIASDIENKSFEIMDKKASILAPISYMVVDNSYNDFNNIEYAKFISEDLANIFFNRKIKRIKANIKSRNIPYVNDLLAEKDFLPPSRLERLNLSLEDFEEYKKLDTEDAQDLIINKLLDASFEQVDKNILPLDFDEAYFTSVFKDDLIIKINKEVYILNGVNLDNGESIDKNLLKLIEVSNKL